MFWDTTIPQPFATSGDARIVMYGEDKCVKAMALQKGATLVVASFGSLVMHVHLK